MGNETDDIICMASLDTVTYNLQSTPKPYYIQVLPLPHRERGNYGK